MAIKFYKPTTPGRRQMTVTDYSELSKVAPEKSLLSVIKATAGRNNTGRITVRHRGGANRRKYRIIDFKRDVQGVPLSLIHIWKTPRREKRSSPRCGWPAPGESRSRGWFAKAEGYGPSPTPRAAACCRCAAAFRRRFPSPARPPRGRRSILSPPGREPERKSCSCSGRRCEQSGLCRPARGSAAESGSRPPSPAERMSLSAEAVQKGPPRTKPFAAARRSQEGGFIRRAGTSRRARSPRGGFHPRSPRSRWRCGRSSRRSAPSPAPSCRGW